MPIVGQNWPLSLSIAAPSETDFQRHLEPATRCLLAIFLGICSPSPEGRYAYLIVNRIAWVNEMLSSRGEWISRTGASSSAEEWMWRTARELAHSGACANWQEIDGKLTALGYPSASAHWSHSFRLVLDRLCARSRATAPAHPAANDDGRASPITASA